MRREGYRALIPEGTEVDFASWQVGPRLMCCGNSGSEVCQHFRKKSCGCEQNSSVTLQTGKENRMACASCLLLLPHSVYSGRQGTVFLLGSAATCVLWLCLELVICVLCFSNGVSAGCLTGLCAFGRGHL